MGKVVQSSAVVSSIQELLTQVQGEQIYFDTHAFIYFLEADETYFERCQPFFEAVESGFITGVAGEMVYAELLVKPLRDNDIFGVERIRTMIGDDAYFKALQHNKEVLELAAHIRATENLSMIDAIHLATALKAKCSHIITNDEKVAKRAKGISVIWLEQLVG